MFDNDSLNKALHVKRLFNLRKPRTLEETKAPTRYNISLVHKQYDWEEWKPISEKYVFMITSTRNLNNVFYCKRNKIFNILPQILYLSIQKIHTILYH